MGRTVLGEQLPGAQHRAVRVRVQVISEKTPLEVEHSSPGHRVGMAFQLRVRADGRSGKAGRAGALHSPVCTLLRGGRVLRVGTDPQHATP